MMRVATVLAALLATLWLPWPLAIVGSIVAAIVSPLLPLAFGILSDTLYLAPHAYAVPFATLVGAGITIAAFVVRTFGEARIMRA